MTSQSLAYLDRCVFSCAISSDEDDGGRA